MKWLPSWRPFTWVIVIINLLFVIGLISAIGSAECEAEEELRGACEAGTAIGAGVLIIFWFFVDAILGIIWLVTNRGRRQCPHCGRDVKKGRTTCKHCGYDFTTQTARAS